ncbi:hypothetical protein CEXT_317551 [Caerostris extrusa]|uniref:Uncharacterized protein n=1 Tax=Caerostris extrusa TaxID=172846 RepID=A0AAV4QVM3_CAEEX|nr:hypothetical protein CEXT_317551 [Caerostris extrusa]
MELPNHESSILMETSPHREVVLPFFQLRHPHKAPGLEQQSAGTNQKWGNEMPMALSSMKYRNYVISPVDKQKLCNLDS